MLFIIFLALPTSISIQTDWCSLVCRIAGKTEQNTMCRYQSRTRGNGCIDITPSMTADKRKELLALHNDFRNQIAGGLISGWPQAGNMRQMTWDMDLEQVALRWAEQCESGHDRCRRTPKFPHVGQNYGFIGLDESTDPGTDTVKMVFEGWIAGINFTTAQIILGFHPTYANHFTQIVWAESYKLGCAEITFKKSANPHIRDVTIICNYGPTGNVNAREIYKTRKSCGACPEGTHCRPSLYSSLCALPSDPVFGMVATNTQNARVESRKALALLALVLFLT